MLNINEIEAILCIDKGAYRKETYPEFIDYIKETINTKYRCNIDSENEESEGRYLFEQSLHNAIKNLALLNSECGYTNTCPLSMRQIKFFGYSQDDLIKLLACFAHKGNEQQIEASLPSLYANISLLPAVAETKVMYATLVLYSLGYKLYSSIAATLLTLASLL